MLDHVTFELQSLGSSCLCLCVDLDRQQAWGSELHMFRLQRRWPDNKEVDAGHAVLWVPFKYSTRAAISTVQQTEYLVSPPAI